MVSRSRDCHQGSFSKTVPLQGQQVVPSNVLWLSSSVIKHGKLGNPLSSQCANHGSPPVKSPVNLGTLTMLDVGQHMSTLTVQKTGNHREPQQTIGIIPINGVPMPDTYLLLDKIPPMFQQQQDAAHEPECSHVC
jgi:hypothetical protein